LLGFTFNTLRTGGVNLTRQKSEGSWACKNCGQLFLECPFCDRIVGFDGLQVGAEMKCKHCKEKFIAF